VDLLNFRSVCNLIGNVQHTPPFCYIRQSAVRLIGVGPAVTWVEASLSSVTPTRHYRPRTAGNHCQQRHIAGISTSSSTGNEIIRPSSEFTTNTYYC